MLNKLNSALEDYFIQIVRNAAPLECTLDCVICVFAVLIRAFWSARLYESSNQTGERFYESSWPF